MWHHLKGSTGSSRTRGKECNRRGRGERIWGASAGGERTRSWACKLCMRMYSWGREERLHNSLFTVECKQRSMKRLAIVIHRIHSRLIFRTTERESRQVIEICRSMENASCGSRLMALLIIYVNRPRTLKRNGSWTWHAREIVVWCLIFFFRKFHCYFLSQSDIVGGN